MSVDIQAEQERRKLVPLTEWFWDRFGYTEPPAILLVSQLCGSFATVPNGFHRQVHEIFRGTVTQVGLEDGSRYLCGRIPELFEVQEAFKDLSEDIPAKTSARVSILDRLDAIANDDSEVSWWSELCRDGAAEIRRLTPSENVREWVEAAAEEFVRWGWDGPTKVEAAEIISRHAVSWMRAQVSRVQALAPETPEEQFKRAAAGYGIDVDKAAEKVAEADPAPFLPPAGPRVITINKPGDYTAVVAEDCIILDPGEVAELRTISGAVGRLTGRILSQDRSPSAGDFAEFMELAEAVVELMTEKPEEEPE